MFDIGKIDIAQPDVTVLAASLRTDASCCTRPKLGKRVVTHGYMSNITIAANLAFLSQHDDDEPCEYSTSQSPLRWKPTTESFPIGSDGRIAIPKGHGLGLSLNEKTIAEFQIA